MNLEIITPDARTDGGFRHYVEQRLRSGLSRFANHIVRGTVSFLDLSGPYGAEQQCRLVLSLRPCGEVSVERRGAGARLALGRVVETAARELQRRFEVVGPSQRRVA
jgi:hypothetical protein